MAHGLRVSRVVGDPDGRSNTISVRVGKSMQAALRELDAAEKEIGELCPGCRVELGQHHLADCRGYNCGKGFD